MGVTAISLPLALRLFHSAMSTSKSLTHRQPLMSTSKSLTHSCTHLPADPPIHPLTNSLTHSLTRSITHSDSPSLPPSPTHLVRIVERGPNNLRHGSINDNEVLATVALHSEHAANKSTGVSHKRATRLDDESEASLRHNVTHLQDDGSENATPSSTNRAGRRETGSADTNELEQHPWTSQLL